MSRYRRVAFSKGEGKGKGGPRGDKPVDWEQRASQLAHKERERAQQTAEEDELDGVFGYERVSSGPERLGFMFNMKTTGLVDEESRSSLSAVDMYFVQEDGETFKASYIYCPYFLVCLKGGDGQTHVQELESYLNRKFEGLISEVAIVEKEDLELPNHLSGLKRAYIRIAFKNVQDLLAVRKLLLPTILKNKATQAAQEAYSEPEGLPSSSSAGDDKRKNVLDMLIDIREYDVPYHTRVAIDKGLRVGKWYIVRPIAGSQGVELEVQHDKERWPLMRTMAFDIETTKAPLKFPNAEVDQVMMISYMIDGQGYLIVNREIVSEDIENFEYTPKPEYYGPFQVTNEANELDTLKRFLKHIKEVRPVIMVTYNGDFFDFPFINKRCEIHKINLRKEIGVWFDGGEFVGRFIIHLDAFYWVQRDSYLPMGSQGLKAVTKAKLNYDPLELDPEQMLPFAAEKPQVLASYSVSDAVATYYLYMKYVHAFIFALCTIIPLPPSDVLRKGSGTLCELLLMVKAFEGNIVCPNKKVTEHTSFYKGHLLESETYIGGHVECLESGVFRSDLPYKFRLNPTAINKLIEDLDEALKFGIVEEAKWKLEDVVNYEEVRDKIKTGLEQLRDSPNIETTPLIYHLDVGAMYPNIILTNRLQPMAIVDQATCAACDFNRPGKNCQRKMQWSWRGKYYPATRTEYNRIKEQFEYDQTPVTTPGEKPVQFSDLNETEQAKKIQQRLKAYSNKVYKKMTVETVEDREAVVCQRENPFYVDTVRAFRDRRYDYKNLTKKWKTEEKEAKNALDSTKAKDMVLLYDSLQLAHKCILNSFYGYVMRAGARWRSIEMAGVVTLTGAHIIKAALGLVEAIGRPLELDTDGIWCMLPSIFPENFEFHTAASLAGKGRALTVSYPCTLLNKLVDAQFHNPQYQTLIDERKRTYATKRECSIYFEVDGPYKAMVLPAAKEEGKNIKKRYAVFNQDGSLAELKGFEIKRRGELKLIKIFQGQVFGAFLEGNTLESCYASVAACANHWLDVLYSKGKGLEDDYVFELISESKTMKESVNDYAGARSTSVTTAKRLAEFLGDEMTKDKGLNCQFVIINRPSGVTVSERAVPVAIFSAEEPIMRGFLRKWSKDSSLSDFDIRTLLDWDYYIGRLASAIQKIITIPAAFQKVKNPVPRVAHPDWLHKRLAERDDTRKQTQIKNFFTSTDIEDAGTQSGFSGKAQFARVRKRVRKVGEEADGRASGGEESGGEDKDKDKENDDGDVEMLKTGKVSEEEELLKNPPLENEDLAKWIKYQTVLWRNLRLAKKREREQAMQSEHREHIQRLGITSGAGDTGLGRTGPRSGGGGVLGYFQQTNTAKNSHWQVISIVEDDTLAKSGSFRVWAFTDPRNLQSFTVEVPRVIYINSRKANPDMGKKVEKHLPRSRKLHHLYELTMPEAEFIANRKDLNAFLTQPEVEGVYETQVPLHYKLLMEMGCCCKLDAKPSLSGSYSLSQLQFRTSTDCRYMEDVIFSKLFLYHSQSGPTKGMYCLVNEAKQEALVLVVSPTADDVQNPQLRPLYNNITSLVQRVLPFPDLTFHAKRVSTQAVAVEALRRRLTDIANTLTVPHLVVSQCSETVASLFTSLPILKASFPVVTVPWNESDDNYPSEGWSRYAARQFITRYVASFDWWDHQLRRARDGNVPIGSIEADHAVFLADMAFARSLRLSSHLLWMSSSPAPDLGGWEEDENYFADELVNPEVVMAGCYRKVCVEFDMHNFAINTVQMSQLIEELEGGIGLSAEEGRELGGGEVGSAGGGGGGGGGGECVQAFRLLKSLLGLWIHNVMRTHSETFDTLLTHFYRWLRSPRSRMYDPALHRMIHKLMRKVFLQLLARFRKLGATVIYADLNRLTLCTGKDTSERAVAYIKYVLETIKARPLFKFIEIEATEMWDTLIFLDKRNYGGILDQEGDDDDDDSPKVVTHWNLSDYLPSLAREYFDVLLGEFCLSPLNFAKQMAAENSQQDQSQSTQFKTPDMKEKDLQRYLVETVEGYFTRKLLEATKDIDDKLPGDVRAGDNTSSASFPIRPGMHLGMHRPAFEFAKAVTHIMGLDNLVAPEVMRLKGNLMRLLDVKAFSEEAQFLNPCLTYVLSDVICGYCSECKDLDLCRDPRLIDHNWDCASCDHPLDKGMIEGILVSVINRRSTAYQVQDVQCALCGKVKNTNMAMYCTCSGSFACISSPQSFATMLKTFEGISRYHNMPLLAETVAWCQRLGAQ